MGGKAAASHLGAMVRVLSHPTVSYTLCRATVCYAGSETDEAPLQYHCYRRGCRYKFHFRSYCFTESARSGGTEQDASRAALCRADRPMRAVAAVISEPLFPTFRGLRDKQKYSASAVRVSFGLRKYNLDYDNVPAPP